MSLLKSPFKDENVLFDSLLLFISFLPVILSFFITTDGASCTLHIAGHDVVISYVCLFKAVTGYNCPGCGMTRCFSYLAHADFVRGWDMSRAGVFFFALCVYEPVYRFSRIAGLPFSRSYFAVKTESVLIVCALSSAVFFFAVQFVMPFFIC